MSNDEAGTDELDNDELNAEFKRATDQFIDLANTLADGMNPENVGMALLYAASRYNAFVVSLHSDDAEKFKADRDQAMEFFTREYQRMLKENLDDYQKVFDDDLKYSHLMKKH